MKQFLKLNTNSNNAVISRAIDLLQSGTALKELRKEFVRINRQVWSGITQDQYLWTNEIMESQLKTCPDLLYCGFVGGKMVATSTSLILSRKDLDNHKTWLEKTGDGFLTTHNSKGDILFGVDLSVLKDAPPKVSDRIVLANLFIAVIGKGLKALYLGSRIPSYHKHKNMKVEDYVYGTRKSGKPLDPELYFYMKDGFKIVEIIPEYMEDPASLNYGVLIKWDNPLHKVTKAFPFLKPVIRWIGKKLFLRLPKKN